MGWLGQVCKIHCNFDGRVAHANTDNMKLLLNNKIFAYYLSQSFGTIYLELCLQLFANVYIMCLGREKLGGGEVNSVIGVEIMSPSNNI